VVGHSSVILRLAGAIVKFDEPLAVECHSVLSDLLLRHALLLLKQSSS
jgi:hypothetical protein